ncbi:AraC-type DNA-binding protein [Burkholderia sp. D7]|nr:AraC-type DNA-binding protein [Burkholderia sp. D7]
MAALTPSFHLSTKSSIFDSADPRDVSAYVNDFVGRHSIQLTSATTANARLLFHTLSDIGLCNIRYGNQVDITTEALRDSYQLQIPLRGTFAWTGAASGHQFRPGEFLLVNPSDPIRVRYSNDCEKLIVRLPVEVLEAMRVEERQCWPHDGIRFLRPVHALSSVDGLAGLLSLMCEEAESTTCNPAIQQHYAQILLHKLLSQLETNTVDARSPVDSQVFGKIKDYILANLQENIALEVLASVANVSLRKLYVLFRMYAQESPRDFIQSLKLGRVRTDLQRARPSDNVTDIAMRYGFSHLGRFSAVYKARFGELPSQTLSRSR